MLWFCPEVLDIWTAEVFSPQGFKLLVLYVFSLQVKTIKVSNVSLGASEQDLKEFFSFSGDIEYVEMQSHDERSQIAFVTFKDPQGAETAVLLSVIFLTLIISWYMSIKYGYLWINKVSRALDQFVLDHHPKHHIFIIESSGLRTTTLFVIIQKASPLDDAFSFLAR